MEKISEQPADSVETPVEAKRALAAQCIEIVKNGGDIPEGIGPKDVSQEVMVGLIRLRNGKHRGEI